MTSLARNPTSLFPRATTRHWYWLFAAVAVGYAPLAVGYMWTHFAAGAPAWQESLTAVFNGDTYARGYNSVDFVRHADYQDHRVVMLVHTTLGGLALALAAFQFSTRLRVRSPRAHRITGRVYFAFMAVSMLTAIGFLLSSSPVDHFVGPAFDLQLWGLALGTLSTGALALVSIRRRNVAAHRAWMGMNIALMLTAPLLRVFWIALAPLWPGADLVANLGGGSIALAIIAPTGGALAVLLTMRRRPDGVRLGHARRTSALLAAFGDVTAALLAVRYAALPEAFPREMLSVLLVPWAVACAVVATGILRARRAQDSTTEKRWRTLAVALATVPVAVHLMWTGTGLVLNDMDAYLSAAMLAPAGPIGVAFAVIVADAAPTARRPAPVRRTRELVAA